MAKLIYKKGREGGRHINDIEGVAIELLDGRTALIHPRYRERGLLDYGSIKLWNTRNVTEIEALRLTDSEPDTTSLLEAGSPAALFVRQFASERFGAFQLPPLLAALEVASRMEEIDEAVRSLEGADTLADYGSVVWSCSRCGANGGWCAVGGIGWYANGNVGFAASNNLVNSFLAVPLLLLPASWDALDA